MTVLPSPKVSRARRLPLIWVVPVVAILVAAWMMASEWREHGPEVTVEFADGSGIEPGKTVLEHKGVPVGTVKAVELKEDLSGVLVKLRIHRSARGLMREGAQFWIVHPEIGFSGVRGLETLLTGVRLNVTPGNGESATVFKGLEKPPVLKAVEDGRAFVLQADRLGALSPGAAVYYRDVRVGSVETSRLSEDSGSVLIRIRVQTPYADLVRTNTQFWNAGGVPLKISLFGGGSQSGSIDSLLNGAVAFATPEEAGPAAAEGAHFRLAHEADKDWLKWRPRIAIQPAEESPDPSSPKKSAMSALLKE
jgi:paraquat-inducible protein B